MNELSMHLASSRDRAPSGSEIELLLELRNDTDSNLVIAGFGSGDGNGGISIAWLLRAQVFDAGGRPLRSSGPIIKSGAEPRLRPIDLAPGETLRTTPLPASSVQMEVDGEWAAVNGRPGTYSIQFTYQLPEDQLPGDHWSGSVISNPVRLHFE